MSTLVQLYRKNYCFFLDSQPSLVGLSCEPWQAVGLLCVLRVCCVLCVLSGFHANIGGRALISAILYSCRAKVLVENAWRTRIRQPQGLVRRDRLHCKELNLASGDSSLPRQIKWSIISAEGKLRQHSCNRGSPLSSCTHPILFFPECLRVGHDGNAQLGFSTGICL